MSDTTLIIIAKAPVPGRCKTRLSPPCTPTEAAELAAAALEDTLQAALATRCARRLLVLDGDPGLWRRPGFDVVPQVPGGFDVRLAGAFHAAGGEAFLIGMDTPQLDPELLTESIATFENETCDAVFGSAPDGGWWSIGLRRPDPQVFLGLPMSTVLTASAQRARLTELGLYWLELPSVRDVDTIDDARAVAELAPGSRFAATLRGVDRLEAA